MKKYSQYIFLLLAFLTFSFAAKSQVYLGGGLALGTGISKLGLNLRGTLDIDEKFVAAPGINFFFKDKSINGIDITYFSVDLDAHYKLIHIGESTEIFPVGGINIFKVGVNGDNNTALNFREEGTKVGLNLGLGAQVTTLTDLNYFGEFKFTVGGIDQSTITAGILYGF